MQPKLIYIAGPFRADTAWDIECNVRKAEELSLEVNQIPGFFAICPHTMTRFFDKAAPDQVFLDGTLELLRRCNGILVVSPYANSYGTASEIAEAERLKIPIFYNLLNMALYWKNVPLRQPLTSSSSINPTWMYTDNTNEK